MICRADADDGFRDPMFTIAVERLSIGAGERPVVFHQAVQRIPGEIKAIDIRISTLQGGDDPQCLRVVIETSVPGETDIERPFSGMPEGGMSKVVRERERFGQIFIQPEGSSQRTRDLSDLQRMSEPGAEMVAFVKNEHLRLMLEPAKGCGMDDAVAIAAKIVARRVGRLGMHASAALTGM